MSKSDSQLSLCNNEKKFKEGDRIRVYTVELNGALATVGCVNGAGNIRADYDEIHIAQDPFEEPREYSGQVVHPRQCELVTEVTRAEQQVSAGDQGKPGMTSGGINGPISQPAESKPQTTEELDDEHSRHFTPRSGCSKCEVSDGPRDQGRTADGAGVGSDLGTNRPASEVTRTVEQGKWVPGPSLLFCVNCGAPEGEWVVTPSASQTRSDNQGGKNG